MLIPIRIKKRGNTAQLAIVARMVIYQSLFNIEKKPGSYIEDSVPCVDKLQILRVIVVQKSLAHAAVFEIHCPEREGTRLQQ